MKQLTLLLMMLSCSVFAQNSDSSRIYYQQAFDEIKAMLEGKTEPSFKRAVFVTENAYFDNSLSYKQFNEQIDFLAYLSKRVMANNTLEYDERDKEEVVKKFAAYRVLKDTITFIYKETADSTYAFQTIPYTYDFDDFWGEKDWSKMFVTKLLKTRTGNCHSLPFLYKILAEELGTTAYLSMSPNHTYIKQWTKKTGWFNTELTSGQFPIDGWIMASGYIKVDAVVNGIYMDTLSMKQSLAVNLTDLAQGYQKKFGGNDSEFILQCLELALKHYPHYVNALIMQAELYKKKYESLMAKHGAAHASELWHLPEAKALFDDMQSQYLHIHNLGYSKMPKEMYLNWLMDIKERDTNKEVERYTFTPPQPFEKYGYKVKVATASNGKYQEFFDLDTLVQIGTVMLNRMTGQVTSFVEYDTVYSEATLEPEVISRWLSPDPLAEEFYDWSPYNYGFSNPIRFSDPTGLAPLDHIYLNEGGKEIYRVENDEPDRTFVIKTTKTTDDLYPKTVERDQKGFSNPITKAEAKNTEKLIKSGNLEGDHMNNLVEIAPQEARQDMVNIVSQDDGKGGTFIKNPQNNREYGGNISSDGRSATESTAGPVSAPGGNGFIRGNLDFHSHPSGSFTSNQGVTGSFVQAPSRHDITTAKGTEYVFGRSSGTVYIYNGTGVVATLPMKRFVTPKP